MGLYASARSLHGYPITPGFEVAGHIEAVGAGVEVFKIGDPVMALTLFGGYTTHLTVPARQVFHIPQGLGMLEAAAVPTAYLTAWYAATELAALGAGQRVLIHSAAGGVGGALAQFARLAGCEVIGMVGEPAKAEYAEACGATRVFVGRGRATRQALTAAFPDGFDAVFDANGARSLKYSYGSLAPGGRLIVYGFHTMLRPGSARPSWPRLLRTYLNTPRFNPLRMTMENRSVMAFNLSFMHEQTERLVAGMDKILAQIAAGQVHPPRVRSWQLARAADAHRALESGKTTGKLVLETRI
jgi:NADPH:quinone reductase-like Zn-dependent oxidoreductase